MFKVCVGTRLAETLKQAWGRGWGQACLPGRGIQYREEERSILLGGEKAAAVSDAETRPTPFGEDRRGKGEGKRYWGGPGEGVGKWAVGPTHNYKDPEMECQKQDVQKDQLPALSCG